jgi:GH15 family glucan-1,4-alpha-glucosidase
VIDFKDMQGKLYSELQKLRLPNGFYVASTGPVYARFVWLRDTFYESLPCLKADPEAYAQTYSTLLEWLKKAEAKYTKFSAMIENPEPKYKWRYLHARVDAAAFEEDKAEWGNKQNDIVGEIMFGIALGESAGIKIIKDRTDIEILNLLVKYLEAIEYWNDIDSGIWEEIEEVRSSSVGACIAGLRALKALNIKGLEIPEWLIGVGEHSLKKLLPRETATRDDDLALLTLIYPFDVVGGDMAKTIIEKVQAQLEKTNGVIRYKGDTYFNNGFSEAEWTLGFGFLGLSLLSIGDREGAARYYHKLVEKCPDGRIPELYLGGTDDANVNTPLGWSNALAWLLGEKPMSGISEGGV